MHGRVLWRTTWIIVCALLVILPLSVSARVGTQLASEFLEQAIEEERASADILSLLAQTVGATASANQPPITHQLRAGLFVTALPQGAHVLLLARTPKALEEVDDRLRAEGGKATLIPLDLADGKAIDALGPSLYERFGRLDVLVGNAGILGPLSPLGHVEAKAWDEVMAVNVTANWRLLCAMDPLLRLTFVLNKGEGWSHRELAGAMGITVSTVKSRIFRARARMQKRLHACC